MRYQTLTTTDPTAQRAWQARLGMFPWLWPRHCTRERCAAMRLVRSGPPRAAAGEVALVSVLEDGSGVSLWKLRAHRRGDTTPESSGFRPDTEQLWREIAAGLPRWMPFVWRHVLDVADLEIEAIRMCGVAMGDVGREPDERLLRGPSFGLAFAIAAASLVTNQPLRTDFVASAGVKNGVLTPVGGIDLKVKGLRALAPPGFRLLVHSEDAAAASSCGDGVVDVVPVASIAQGIEQALREPLKRVLVRAGADPASVADLVEQFFALATGLRVNLVDWTPVREAAQLALEEWPLTSSQRTKLELAAAFAERHESNAGALRMPDPVWLRTLQREIRLQVAAHLVSQATNTLGPTPEEARVYAASLLPGSLHEASLGQLRVFGALARMDAVLGYPRRALRKQRALAAILLQLREFTDLSYQLSEWLRLAGTLADRNAFADALQVDRRVAMEGGLPSKVRPFVAHARARALAALGDATAAPLLEELAESRDGASHLPWSAMRLLVRFHAASDVERARRQLATLSEAALPIPSVAVYPALARIDLALALNDLTEASAGLNAARQAEPGVVGHLVAAAGRRATRAVEYVAAFYPD